MKVVFHEDYMMVGKKNNTRPKILTDCSTPGIYRARRTNINI